MWCLMANSHDFVMFHNKLRYWRCELANYKVLRCPIAILPMFFFSFTIVIGFEQPCLNSGSVLDQTLAQLAASCNQSKSNYG